jgi:glycosyltransferase involved in cell wall biosynthesis
VSFFNIPEEKIKVVYQSCRESFSKTYSGERKSEIKEKYRLPDKFLLNVGSMEERKNLLLIVKALKKIDPDIHLVAAGKSTPYVHDVMKYVNDNNLQHRVHLLHEVSFSDLPVLYHSARLFIYPSFFEGFGIPVIEALNSGIPVIAATGSCLEEAGGPGSVYVDPNNEKELARMINVILYDPDLQHKMIAGGKQYAERFLPDRIADDMMNVYSNLFD